MKRILQTLRRLSAPLIILSLLAGCADRAVLGFLEAPEQAQNIQTVFVATNRAATIDGGFGKTRSRRVNYASYDVSIPDAHLPGNLEWPRGAVKPLKDMGIARHARYDSASAFKAQINRAFTKRGALSDTGKREVHIFIHGYNNTFAESLYRMAQLKYDYDEAGPTILYSWPSAGQARLYTYDRDSVLFARDGLVELLRALANSPVQEITLTAHSMGTQLLMEALRQISLQGDKKTRRKIKAVTLLSPDIDVDLFNSQVTQLTPLPQPFSVLGSRQDRFLRLSSWLSGEPKRVGNDFGSGDIENKNIKFFDLTKFTDGDIGNHFLLATSPTLLALVKKTVKNKENIGDIFAVGR